MIKSKPMLFRPTYDVWKLDNPGRSTEEWENEIKKNNIYDMLKILCSKVDLSGIQELTVVVLDEEYTNWLKLNQKANSSRSKAEYGISLSDKELLRLLKKNEMDMNYAVFCVPLTVMYKEDFPLQTHYTLDRKKSAYIKLLNFLESKYGIGNICLLKYVMDGMLFRDSIDKIINMGKAFFQDGVNVSITDWEYQNHQRKNRLYTFVIPFVVSRKMDKPVIQLAESNFSPLFDANLANSDLIQSIKKEVFNEDTMEFCEVCPGTMAASDITWWYKNFVRLSEKNFK